MSFTSGGVCGSFSDGGIAATRVFCFCSKGGIEAAGCCCKGGLEAAGPVVKGEREVWGGAGEGECAGAAQKEPPRLPPVPGVVRLYQGRIVTVSSRGRERGREEGQRERQRGGSVP